MPAERKGRKKLVERRPMLDQRKKETMLMVLIRNASALVAVRDLLTPKHVAAMGACFAVLWRVVLALHERHNTVPTKELIMDDVQVLINDRPGDLDQSELIEMESFLDAAFDDASHSCVLSESKMHRDEALHTARLFIEEAVAADLAGVMVSGSTPTDVPALLQAAHDQVLAVAGMTQADAANDQVFPTGWDTEERKPLRDTGNPIFNRFLGGGDKGGEVIGFFGPSGGCKSLVACQGAAYAIKQASVMFSRGETGGRTPKVFFVSTEILLEDLRIRLLANMANIPSERLERMRGLSELSHADAPGIEPGTDYELNFYRNARGREFKSEFQRAQQAQRLVNSHLVFIDFTGTTDRATKAGMGGIRELAGIVEAKIRQADGGIYPFTFWIDHAAALAGRMVDSGAYSTDDLRHILKNMPLLCRDHLAGPHGTAVWIMQQLSGEANKRGPATDVDHTDSDECKHFAMYCNFAIISGKPTEDGQMLTRLRCTKHRRQPSRDFAIGKIDGRFYRLRDVSHLAAMDGNTIRMLADLAATPQNATRRDRNVTRPPPSRPGQQPPPGVNWVPRQ